jgi:type I restriction enzyme, S subunit
MRGDAGGVGWVFAWVGVFEMSTVWPTRKLRDIADIRVSNVDKKICFGETPVRLCNYMDVYSNDYVTSRIDFMDATASLAEIARFGLVIGDVIITKDSETPDDIGIPTVIAEDIVDLVCGYHLALIRPNSNELDSVYLAKQLATSQVIRYFALHASGSTRYGLPISAIESLLIPLPPKREQAKIAEILATVDRAIEQTEALIAKQQRIKTGLMQDLLTRGIDAVGKLRTEQTHAFKDSPLGRIPMEWEVMSIGEIFEIQLGKMLNQKASEGKSPFFYLGNRNVQWDLINTADLPVMDFNDDERKKYELRQGDILVCEGGEVGRTSIWRGEVENCYYQKAIHRLRPINGAYLPELFLRFMMWGVANGILADFTSQTSIAHLTQEKLGAVPIIVPPISDQLAILHILAGFDANLNSNSSNVKKLHTLKTALMQDLLTGRKRVTSLLDHTQVSA